MKTGFHNLDNNIKIKGGDLIIIASRPAMGKTTLALNILGNVAIKDKKSVAFFSLEEGMENIVNKLIIRTSMVEADKFKIYDAPIFIDVTAQQTIDNIFKKSCELKEKENIELIIIDYLQLIQFDKRKVLSRDDEIDGILQELKTLAEKLNVPVIVTSQLSRRPEEREDKRPVITDFTNTASSILKYADKIWFLYRDSYYNKENKSNITDIIITQNGNKNENISTIKLGWMPEYFMFGNTINLEKN